MNKIGTNKRVIRDGLEKEDDYESEDSDDESTMEEESTQQNTETTTEKPLQWALKQGTIPGHKDYHGLHQFGIPIDNTPTTQLLLLELQKCQEQVQGVLVPGAAKNLRTPKLLYVHVPQGLSRNVHKAFVKTVSDMIQWNSADARQKCATRLSRRLDKDYSDSYLQVLQESGYALSQLAPKMSANLWTAMCEDINLQTGQQRIINSYLSYHFGKRVYVSEQEIREAGSNYVPYVTANRVIVGHKKKILYSHIGLHKAYSNVTGGRYLKIVATKLRSWSYCLVVTTERAHLPFFL
jgi:hypothetical protein